MAEVPALLIAVIGGAPRGRSSGPRLLVYGYADGNTPRLLLHATDPSDGRVKGHQCTVSLLEFEGLVSKLLSRGDSLPVVHLKDTALSVDMREKKRGQFGRVWFTSDSRRDTVAVWMDFENELPAVLEAVNEHLPYLPYLMNVDLEN